MSKQTSQKIWSLNQPSRRLKKRSSEEGSPAWMATYGDMVTLLLTFFILLYSISVIDIERFQKMVISIQTSFLGHTGIMDQTPPPAEGEDTERAETEGFIPEPGQLAEQQRVEEMLSEVRFLLEQAGLGEAVELRLEERGIVMELPEQIFFERSSAVLRDEARALLDQLSIMFYKLEEQVIVEGHTCNLPINTPEFPSNWELSVTRSVRVIRYLVEVRGLDPRRFTATGYGEHYPLESNDTAEGRAKNRRVTIVISI